MSSSNISLEDFEQHSRSHKLKRRKVQRILSYILPRLFRWRRWGRKRRSSSTRNPKLSPSAPFNESRPTQTGDRLSIWRPDPIEDEMSFCRTPSPPMDDRVEPDGHADGILASGLTIISSSSGVSSPLGIQNTTPSRMLPGSTSIRTEQTTPLPLDDNPSDIPDIGSSSTNNGPIPGPPSDKNRFVRFVYIIRPNGSKGGALMSFDTQAHANVLSVQKCQELGFEWEPYEGRLLPFHMASAPVEGIKPRGIVRKVPWHIPWGMTTNLSDFLVVDMEFDAILSHSDITKHQILGFGPGMERMAVERIFI